MARNLVSKMSKKKYFKSTPKHCPNHKGQHCTCEIASHRYWMSKKYYGKEEPDLDLKK